MNRPAVFLDRDGTVNEDLDFVTRPEDLHLLPGAAEALKALQEAGYLLIVVTNQSGVARGKLTEEQLCGIHEHLDELLEAHGVQLTDYYYCPHHPTEGDDEVYTYACRCRKPLPGLFLDAAQDYRVDLARSFAVGDAVRDLQAAEAAGLRALWVRSGRTREEELASATPAVQPLARCADLAEAARWILEHAPAPGRR
ncbi:MAG: D-glycero-beta-D-manno-heptose 1,7-bisphosphate 7-phosphatase [Planctomycetes bacterium]|nr:D-glycero-beta-D-manno-heptose 1,7-bisphosphate 7-phosphatase [Planctomycetota bacterium]